jgi:hypothetical protein
MLNVVLIQFVHNNYDLKLSILEYAIIYRSKPPPKIKDSAHTNKEWSTIFSNLTITFREFKGQNQQNQKRLPCGDNLLHIIYLAFSLRKFEPLSCRYNSAIVRSTENNILNIKSTWLQLCIHGNKKNCSLEIVIQGRQILSFCLSRAAFARSRETTIFH